MSTIRVKWHDREVVTAIKRMKAHGGSWAPVFKDLKKPFREDLKAHAADVPYAWLIGVGSAGVVVGTVIGFIAARVVPR